MWRGFPRQMDGLPMFSVPSNRALFLDGGGKLREHKVIAFCGFMAHPAAMEDFENTWRALCSAASLPKGLHMSEAMTWNGEVWQAKRAEWGDRADAERLVLLRGFAATIARSPLRAVGNVASSAYISEKGLNSTRPDLVMFEKAISNAVGAMAPDGSLFLFCDWEDGFDALCCKLLAKLRIERPDLGHRVKVLSFADDMWFAQLQAADMLAYLACKDLLRKANTPDAPVDPLYAELTASTVTTSMEMTEMFDADTFRRMVDAHRK
jgi:hypothetical protein